MRCEDVLLELQGSLPPNEALKAHLASCADCRSAARAVELASLPPLTSAEVSGLGELVASTRKGWIRAERLRVERGAWWKQAARLAVAAGLGALTATGALSLRGGPRATASAEPPTVQRAVAEASAEVAPDEANLSDDEVFFEVSWPATTEGDL